jgi:hypothetical protein
MIQRVSAYTQPKVSVEYTSVGLILITSLVLTAYFSANVYTKQWQSLTQLDNYRKNLEGLSALGDFLENNIQTTSIFIANPRLMNYLPGLSSKSDVVLFRTNEYSETFIQEPMSVDKINLILSRKSSVSIKTRLSILENNRSGYILVEEQPLKDYYAGYPQFFSVQKFGNFWIFELRKTNP